MLSAADNDRLTRSGPGTAMGATLRAYWMPALLARELPEPGGPPRRLRLLGEDFVAFRDATGQVAVVDARCPHRGADLFFGRNEDCGLRCVYHGWKFDRHGRCVELPNALPDVAERLKPRAAIRALHVHEAGDLVWVNFTPIDQAPPPLPDFEFLAVPAAQRFVSKKLQQCNWVQACEGGLDTAHFSFLHAAVRDGARASLLPADGRNDPGVLRFQWLVDDPAPRFTVLEHQAGLLLCAARHANDGQTYWRMTQYLLPNHSLAPGAFATDTSLGNTWVPIDDTSCWIYCYAWHPERPIGAEERRRLAAGSGIFAEVDDRFVPLSVRENDYRIDRERQRTASYTGIAGISEQDQAIADSQGPIADRTRELLTHTDLGIVRFRQSLLAATAAVSAGDPAPGAAQPAAYRVRSGDALAAPDVPATAVARERFGAYWGVPVTR